MARRNHNRRGMTQPLTESTNPPINSYDLPEVNYHFNNNYNNHENEKARHIKKFQNHKSKLTHNLNFHQNNPVPINNHTPHFQTINEYKGNLKPVTKSSEISLEIIMAPSLPQSYEESSTSHENKRVSRVDSSEEVSEKRIKLNENYDKANSDESGSVNINSLQACETEITSLNEKIASQLAVVREIKEKFNVENDVLKELKIIKRSLKQKLLKICRAITKNDDSDDSEIEMRIGAPDEIIDLESSSDSNAESDSSSDDVEFITETKILPQQTVFKFESTDEPIIKMKSTTFVQKGTKSTSFVKKETLPITPVQPDSASQDDITGVSISAEKSVDLKAKVESNNLKNDAPYVPIPIITRPDAYNGLFNAIEPKLDTIIVSPNKGTFITDIKVFNNRLFLSASHGLLRQYDLSNHQCIMDYSGHRELIHCIHPTAQPAGMKRLLSGGFDQILFIHNIDTGEVLNQIETDRPIMAICDLFENVFFGTGGGTVICYSLSKSRQLGSFRPSEYGISCMIATKETNHSLLFVGSNNGDYSIWNATTFHQIKVITPVSHVEAPIGFVMLQKQRILAFTKNHVHFIYYAKSKNTTSMNHFSQINSMCLTKNYAIVGGITGQIGVYRCKGSNIHKNPIISINNSASSILSMTFYNNTIITGDRTGKVHFNRLVES